MSKNNSTKELIIEKALSMFNKYGVEYVGVRELAKELGMKGGNITYYFPTKDDIVFEVSRRLGEENNVILERKENLTIVDFLAVFGEIFRNHYKYRALFFSIPNLVKQNEAVREQYHERQKLRQETILAQLADLEKGGFISIPGKKELDSIFNVITMVSRFWLSNAAVEGELSNLKLSMNKYLDVMAGQLLLIATAKGKRDIDKYYNSL